jgi:putative transposase
MKELDVLHLTYPFYGSRKLTVVLCRKGYTINRKRVQRLMQRMGLEALYCKPKTTVSNPHHKIYPYLLRDLSINQPNHVWSIDITYIRMVNGFLYLTAVIDWYSRFVLSWELSNTLHYDFCIEAVKSAFKRYGTPEIFNSDQGAQFTATAFTQILLDKAIRISMDGRGRALDNVFIERLWRSVKYEEVYLNAYTSGSEAYTRLRNYFEFYNKKRPHAALDDLTPFAVYSTK